MLLAMSSLRAQGWQQSLGAVPVDGAGRPIPWLSYSAIRFLDSLDLTTSRVLEYGSGTPRSGLLSAASTSSRSSTIRNGSTSCHSRPTARSLWGSATATDGPLRNPTITCASALTGDRGM